MNSKPSTQFSKPVKKTYYGLAAYFCGMLSCLFLGAHFGVAYLAITPRIFSQLNQITAFLYCILSPLAFGLGVIGHIVKNDSKQLSRIAMAIVIIPFLIVFSQFIYSMLTQATWVQ